MNPLEEALNYRFKNPKLLKRALIHRSYSQQNNERLEFLGDGCLNFIIGELLFTIQPNATEGELSNLRAHLVKEGTLAELSLKLGVNHHVTLSQGERNNDGALRPSLLADMFEAILGAIYLDSDFNTVKKIIRSLYHEKLERIKTEPVTKINEHFKDPKSRLQERLQALNKETPSYEIISITGKDHAKIFKVKCIFENYTTIAEGTSKRRAEQQAARIMLEKIS